MQGRKTQREAEKDFLEDVAHDSLYNNSIYLKSLIQELWEPRVFLAAVTTELPQSARFPEPPSPNSLCIDSPASCSFPIIFGNSNPQLMYRPVPNLLSSISNRLRSVNRSMSVLQRGMSKRQGIAAEEIAR
jgi:hypothetical protein